MMMSFDPNAVVLAALKQRLADVERFLAFEEAAERGADVKKIERLRGHAIALRVVIREQEVSA
jgi:hypothetical protein